MGRRRLIKIKYVGGKKVVSRSVSCSSCNKGGGTKTSFSSVNQETIGVPQTDGRVLNARFSVGQVGSYDEDTAEYLLAVGKSEVHGIEENRFIIVDGEV